MICYQSFFAIYTIVVQEHRVTEKVMLMLISKTLFYKFSSNCSREGTSYSSSEKDRTTIRTVPKACTNKTAAYQLTKLSALFMITLHTFYSLWLSVCI